MTVETISVQEGINHGISLGERILPPVAMLVNKGVKLCRQIAKLSEELDRIKTTLRTEATEVKQQGGKTPVVFLGSRGSATVTFKVDSLKEAEGKKFSDLQKQLPPAVFHNLFDVEMVVKPCKGFREKLLKLSDEDRELVLAHVTPVPSTPAVEFSK